MDYKDVIRIQLKSFEEDYFLVFFNVSNTPIRCWEFHNSWGWHSFQLKILHQNKEYTIQRRKDVIFTRDGPSFFSVPREDIYLCKLGSIRDDWDINLELKNTLLRENFTFFIEYEVNSTAESLELDVFTGSIKTNEQVSISPHPWLLN